MNTLYKDLTFTVYSSSFEKSTTGDGKRLIRGYASTSDLDRQKEIISRIALEKAKNDLLQNTTVFMDHQHTMLPVGKVIDCTLDDKGLLITVSLSSAKFVDDIWTLCQEGVLNSFSIGGVVMDGHDIRGEDGKSYYVIDELAILEVSICGIPANPSAKFQPIYKSFNSAIAEQIKQKEESQMAKQDKSEVTKSEDTQEPTKVYEPSTETKEVAKEAIVDAPKAVETTLEAPVEAPKPQESILVAKEVETPKSVIETPKVSDEIEKAKVDETPSDKATDIQGRPCYYYYYEKDGKKVQGRRPYSATPPKKYEDEVTEEKDKTIDETNKYYPYYYYYYGKDGNRKLGRRPYSKYPAKNEDIQAEVDKQILTLLQEILSELKVAKNPKVEAKEEIKDEKSIEVVSTVKSEETIIEKNEVEKVVEKKEEVPTRKSLAIVVPSPYEDEKENKSDPKEEEVKKNMGWNKLIFGNKS